VRGINWLAVGTAFLTMVAVVFAVLGDDTIAIVFAIVSVSFAVLAYANAVTPPTE